MGCVSVVRVSVFPREEGLDFPQTFNLERARILAHLDVAGGHN